MLNVTNLTKRFGSKTILDALSFKAHRGEIAVFLGASGVGKSTLLRVLNNLESFDSGTILLDDKPLDLSQAHIHQVVGMVFQQFNLFDNLTVLDNITLAMQLVADCQPEVATKEALALLNSYGLREHAHTYPHDLSGGQKQRLALARALALKPTILCLDEPTSALDPLLTGQIAQTITDLAKQNLIVLIATHDTGLLKNLNCTIHLLDGGSIIETATTQQLQQSPSTFPKIIRFLRG